jgi:hypothetical protein
MPCFTGRRRLVGMLQLPVQELWLWLPVLLQPKVQMTLSGRKDEAEKNLQDETADKIGDSAGLGPASTAREEGITSFKQSPSVNVTRSRCSTLSWPRSWRCLHAPWRAGPSSQAPKDRSVSELRAHQTVASDIQRKPLHIPVLTSVKT